MIPYANCTALRTPEFIAIAAVNSALGGVSFIACLLAIGVVVLFKKYKFPTQRLILYLCVAVGLENFFVAVQASVYFPVTEAYWKYCKFTGFINQIAIWSTLLAYCCITINLFIATVLKKWHSKQEWVYFFVIFMVPFLFNWIPFIDDTYGEAGAWCWIRDTNNDANCSSHVIGVVLRQVIWYAPLYPIIFGTLILYIIILIALQRRAKKYTGKFDPISQKQKENNAKNIKPLLVYPVLFLFFNTFSLINRLYEALYGDSNNVLFWLQAIATPLQGAVISLVYTLDSQTCANLRWNRVKGVIVDFYSQEDQVMEYPIEDGTRSDSLHRKSFATTYTSSSSSNKSDKKA